MEEKLQELLQSEEFVKKLAACPNKNKVQELFASEDVELSMEEIDAFGNTLKQLIEKAKNSEADGELAEDDLEDVAGGVALEVVLGVTVCVGGLAALIGFCIDMVGTQYGWWD